MGDLCVYMCDCVCVCVYAPMCIQTNYLCVCVCLHLCVYLYLCVHACICAYMHLCVCMYACVCICMYVFTCVCMHASVCTHVYVCVYVIVLSHRQQLLTSRNQWIKWMYPTGAALPSLVVSIASSLTSFPKVTSNFDSANVYGMWPRDVDEAEPVSLLPVECEFRPSHLLPSHRRYLCSSGLQLLFICES